jgi:hypothetical protein
MAKEPMSYEKYKSEVKRTNSPGHSIRPISQKRYEEHVSPAKSKALEKKKEGMSSKEALGYSPVKRDRAFKKKHNIA